MEFKQYPSYKYSAVEWLGDIPKHWESNRLKKYLIERNEKNTPVKTDNLLSVTMYQGVIPVSEKQGNGGNKPKENLENYKISYPNDIVLNSMNVIVGSVGLNKYMGLISPAYYALYNRNKNNNIKFFSYIFHNPFFQKGLFGLGNGIMYKESEDGKLNTIRLKIPMEKLNQVVLPCPSISEQNQIISFLDTETARIDNLISKQEKLIELLEEQRKSIISHAVTKGLNPNAPMKDSGVEWLGDVPEHWEVTFIKYITKKISSGKTPLGGAEVYTDEGVIFLRSQNIYNDGLHLDDVSFIPHEIHASMKSSAVKKNDVLLNITGGSIGRTCLVDCEIGEANVNQHVCIIRTSKDKYAKWLSVFMKSNSAQSQIFYSQTGAGREGLNFSQIGNMRLLFPPFVEQQEILDFLDQENLRFDNLILKQQSLIEKMKEYRASIISHAVTGKIDVREFGT